jgi:hypothetical protein
MYAHWREREHEDIDVFGLRIPCFYHCFITMWVVKILPVSVYEGTTQVVECFDRLLES